MNVSFLLGAGASRESGFPLALELTDTIREADYCFDSEQFTPGLSDECSPFGPGIGFLTKQLFDQLLKICDTESVAATGGQDAPRKANYEDVYVFAHHLSTRVKGSFISPPVGLYLNQLNDVVEGLCAQNERFNPEQAYSRVCKLISDAVYHFLGRIEIAPRGFQLLESAIDSERVKRLTIATLNHDQVLENLLDSKLRDHNRRIPKWSRKPYTDGFNFRLPDGQVLWYDRIALVKGLEENPHHNEEIVLLKLHGSIDWWRTRVSRGGNFYDDLCRPLSKDINHLVDSRGNSIGIPHGPSFLTGGTKEAAYQSGVYADHWSAFLARLDMSIALIVTGFSWNDRGVVNRVQTWLNEDADRKLYIYDEDCTSAQLALLNLDHNGQVFCLERFMCDEHRPIEDLLL